MQQSVQKSELLAHRDHLYSMGTPLPETFVMFTISIKNINSVFTKNIAVQQQEIAKHFLLSTLRELVNTVLQERILLTLTKSEYIISM